MHPYVYIRSHDTQILDWCRDGVRRDLTAPLRRAWAPPWVVPESCTTRTNTIWRTLSRRWPAQLATWFLRCEDLGLDVYGHIRTEMKLV